MKMINILIIVYEVLGVFHLCGCSFPRGIPINCEDNKISEDIFSVDIKRDAIIFIDDGEEDAWTKIEDINVDNDYYIVDEDIPDDYIAEIIEGVGDIGYDSGDDIADANEVCIPYKIDIENYCPSDTSEIKISMGIQKN